MIRLTDLPNEIIVMIIRFFQPYDMESFASTCSKLHSLAAVHLERHRPLMRRHRIYRYSYPNTPDSRRSPLHLVDEILQEPRTALYVQKLSLNGWDNGWYCEWMENSDRKTPEETMSRIRGAVLQLVPQAQTSAWLRRIKIGDESYIILLLLLLLPNLSTLEIEDTGNDLLLFYEQLHWIVTMKGPDAPLPSLRHVQIRTLDLLVLFAALPSMQSIHAFRIRADSTSTWSKDLISRISNVRKLVLDKCSIAPKLLSSILRGFRALRSFTCDSDYCYDMRLYDKSLKFVPSWVRTGLFASASLTLESLTLLSHNKDRHLMGEIRSFKSLRNLHTESQLLLSEEDDHRRDTSLAMALPANTETLKLECSGRNDEIGIAKLLSTLAQLKIAYVPALTRVEVVTRNGVQDFNTSQNDPAYARYDKHSLAAQECYTFEAIVNACKAQGFDLLVKAFDQAESDLYNL